MGVRRLGIAQARRIALAAQGFGDPRPGGRVDARHFRRVMGRIDLLQLDSVNVCARSHYLPFFSRLGAYDRAALDRWLNHSGENTEGWAHVASVTPVERHPLLHFRREWFRQHCPRTRATMLEHGDYAAALLDEIGERGALPAHAVNDPGQRTGPWWGLGKGKRTMEALFLRGDLAIAHRDARFVCHYDLPQRVLPHAAHAEPAPTAHEAQKALLLRGARAHGIGTHAEFADYYRLNIPRTRPLMTELADEGQIEAVRVDGQDLWLDPQARRPRAIRAATFLTPFDPLVWHRPRAEWLFGFDYRIEIYTPAPKRRFGYYCLPFLLDEAIVGRVDLKADRKLSALIARASWFEAGVDDVRVARAMAENLAAMAEWLGLDRVEIADKGNGAAALRRSNG